MNSISDKILGTIKIEELKNSADTKYIELQQFVKTMKELGVYKKPEYTLPPKDTIGKNYFSSLNRRLNS